MDDLHLKQISRAFVITGNELQRAAEALGATAAAFAACEAAKAMGVDLGCKWKDGERDALDALRRVMNEAGGDIDKERLQELAEFVEDPEDIPPPRKIPRPPKRIGSVNKTNFAASRPPRRARSSCRIIKNR